MSSGEAEVVSVRVTDLNTNSPSGDYWPNSYWSDNTTNTFTYTYSHRVYMYQITCPRCGTMNWCELNKIIECSGKHVNNTRRLCKARLKATNEVVDYEVPVK